MPSEKRVIALRLDDDTIAKLEKIAATEMRSMSNLAEVFVRWSLKRYIDEGGFTVQHSVPARSAKAPRANRSR